MSTGGIVSQAELCLEALGVLAEGVPTDDPNREDAAWLTDQQLRFDLWCARLGVLAPGDLSITHRLRRNQVAARAIAQVLEALLINLRLCIDFVLIYDW